MENADPRRRHSPTGHIDKGGETTIERRAVLRAIGIALRVQGRNYDQVTEQNRGAYCHHLLLSKLFVAKTLLCFHAKLSLVQV